MNIETVLQQGVEAANAAEDLAESRRCSSELSGQEGRSYRDVEGLGQTRPCGTAPSGGKN